MNMIDCFMHEFAFLSNYARILPENPVTVEHLYQAVKAACPKDATHQAEALKIYELETAQRKAIAERHAELRTSQIAPLRKNIEKFKQFELF